MPPSNPSQAANALIDTRTAEIGGPSGSPSEFDTDPASIVPMEEPECPRVLVIDDLQSIHEDFRKILVPPSEQNPELSESSQVWSGPAVPRRTSILRFPAATRIQTGYLPLLEK